MAPSVRANETPMVELATLLHHDHQDLELALSMIVDAETAIAELPNLLEVLRLALAVHVTAEARVWDRLLATGDPVRPLQAKLALTRIEHTRQQLAADELARLAAGSSEWYEGAIELRAIVLDHAWEIQQPNRSLRVHLDDTTYARLAGSYATERMRVLATTSPVRLAQAITSSSIVAST
jgi:hypothetical protein